MGSKSIELCGGTHCSNTGEIGLFKIFSEASVAAGVRRIEGTTGLGVLQLMKEKESLIAETARVLKANNPADIAARAASLQGDYASAKKEIDVLNAKLASGRLDSLLASAEAVGAIRLVVGDLGDTTPDTVRSMCDKIKDQHKDMVAVFSVHAGAKLNFIGAAGADAVKAGVHCGKLIGSVAAVTGGKGGGRPDSAMAGGSDLSKIGDALASVKETVSGMLK